MTIRYCAVVLLCALAACGSASDSTTFAVPPGYVQQASLGPFFQMWKNDKSVIGLMALPVKADLHTAVSQTSLKDATVTSQKDITICNGQPAVLMDAQGNVNVGDEKNPEHGRAEVIATEVAGKTYIAMYIRPMTASADPAADAAIRNVCPKS
jgi:hypothetical protein